MRKNNTWFLLLCLSLLVYSCKQEPVQTEKPPDPKSQAVQAAEPTQKPIPTLEPTPIILEDIGYPNAPYPTGEFGDRLWQDDFAMPDPAWQPQVQPEYEQDMDRSYAIFTTSGEEHRRIELSLDHPRNVVYQLSFKLPEGFTDFSFASDPAAGTHALITCFGKDNQMNFRVLLRSGHEARLQQLVEFSSMSDDGWYNLEIRQYDRYVDLFVNGRHGNAFRMPDEMVLDHGGFFFEVYNPFGDGASLMIDSINIYESLPENVFLDTLPLTPLIDHSQEVLFSDLAFTAERKDIPERVQTADGWQASYVIAPGDVRSPNDLEFTSGDELVVLQQRNWGLISLTPGEEAAWYLDTKQAMNELVTNGMLDRDHEGNLYLMHDQRVFLVDQPGQAEEIFTLTGHFTGLAQSPLDGMLYFIEDAAVKRWNGSQIETVMEGFAGEGHLVFTSDGTPYFCGWGSRQIFELVPETFEYKQAVFNGAFALPDTTPAAFNRINVQNDRLVLTYNSEVLRIDPRTGTVEILASGFNQLEGISTASDGRICFTSRFDSGVYCWKDGLVDIAAMPNFLMTPMGMAVNSQGDIYSGNDEATHLFHYDSGGSYIAAYDVNVCQSPQVDMTFDNEDNLYVSAGEYFTNASSLVRIDPQGQVEILVDYPDIRYPSGIDWYDGHVYVVEAETGNLYRLEDDNSLSTILTVPSSSIDNTIPMRMDQDGNFFIFITADKQMKLYQVSQNNEWKEIIIGVDLHSLVTLEYWGEKNALLLGFTGFWDGTGKVMLYDLATSQAQTLLSGAYAVSGLAVTPDGDILINDDWDNSMILLRQSER